jgi:hypothetical protein
MLAMAAIEEQTKQKNQTYNNGTINTATHATTDTAANLEVTFNNFKSTMQALQETLNSLLTTK